MNNQTIKKNFLAIICMICILAGIFVPANTTLMAEESRPGISCGYHVTDGQLVICLYGYNFEKICSYTQSISYDSELVRLAEYKVEDALKGSLVSVNEQQGNTTIAIADMAGVSIHGYGMVTLKYDLLFEGTKEIVMEQNVLECTNVRLENVEVEIVLPAKGHSWDAGYTVDVQPTYESAGSQSIHCKNCTKTKDVQTIPVLVKDDKENGTIGENGASGGNTSGTQNIGITQTPDNSKVTAAGSTKSKTKKPVIKFLNSKKKTITKVSLKKKKSLKVTVKVTPSSSKIKLAKLSKKQKKIAVVSLKKNKLTIKGKKKGTITIKVTSGKTAKKLKIVVK